MFTRIPGLFKVIPFVLPLALAGVALAEMNPGIETLQQLPLVFEENLGQTDAHVRYLSRSGGLMLFLTDTETVATLGSPTARAVVRVRFPGANPNAKLEGVDSLPGVANYYLGNDPRQWRENVPTYGQVARRQIYPGIDLIYHGGPRKLEYDFVVAPGADPKRIILAFQGVRKMRIDANGDLSAETASGKLIHHKPYVYQERDSVRTTIPGRWVLRPNNEATFQLGPYNASLPLVIDPILDYSSYLGGRNEDQATSVVATSAAGSIVAGYTNSPDFPGPTTQRLAGGFDVFVATVNLQGRPSITTTYIGGSGDDKANAISLAPYGDRLAIAGETNSRNFPTKAETTYPPPLQAAYAGGASDAFIAQLDLRTFNLVYSTYLGGSGDDRAYGVALDSAYRAYVTGETNSANFPTRTPMQAGLAGGADAFVTLIAGGGASLVYSTYLGGTDDDRGRAITTDFLGEAYVAGETQSKDLPTKNAFQPLIGGSSDAFLAKLARDGSSLTFSTYLGGAGSDRAAGIALDSDSHIYVAGTTASTDFPTVTAQQGSFGGGATDAFLARFTLDASALTYSTFIGGSGDDAGLALAVTPYGDAYVAGATNSGDLPTTDPLQAAFAGGNEDAFLGHFDSSGSPIHVTYFGGTGSDRALGIAVDPAGSAWIVGRTDSPDLPVKQPSQNSVAGGPDAFIAKISTRVLAVPNAIIGKDLQVALTVGFGVLPAIQASGADPFVVTISSSDPSKLLVSKSATEPGSPSVTLSPMAGALSFSSQYFLQALDGSGTVQYTVTAPGYLTRTATVTLGPSGFIPLYSISPPWSSLAPGGFATTTVSPNTRMFMYPVVVDPGTGRVFLQDLRAGLADVSVEVTSSDPSVGTITTSPVTVKAGDNSGATTEFHPVGPGKTTLAIGTPSGFSTLANATLTVTVTPPALLLRSPAALGKDLQEQAVLNINPPPQNFGLDVGITVTSDDPSRLLVSADPAQPGSRSATVRLQGPQATVWVQGLAGSGTVHLTASASGLNDATATVTLVPSGFVMQTPGNTSLDFTTTTLSPDSMITVRPAQLDPGSMSPISFPSRRAGVPSVQLTLTSSDPKVGTVTSPVVFNAGDSVQQAQFHPLAVGSTQLTLSVPEGLSTPSSGLRSTVTVVIPSIKMQDIRVGMNLQGSGSIQLTAPAPAGGLTVTVTSTDPQRVLLSSNSTTAGQDRVTVQIFAGSYSGNFMIYGLASSGAVQLTASATGFTSGAATVTLAPAGFVFSGNDTSATLFGSTQISLYPALIDPNTGVPMGSGTLRPGLSRISVDITTSSPDVGSLAGLPLTLNAGDSFKYVSFKANSLGSTVLSIVQPPGFSTPIRGQQMRVTVTPPTLSVQSSLTLGKDLQVQSYISLPVSPPPGHDITVTSSDPEKVLLSLDRASAGSPSITLPSGTAFFVQALAGEGNAQITASAPDFLDATSTVTLNPSGFVISQPVPPSRDGTLTTTTLSSPTQLSISLVPLDPVSLSPVQYNQQFVRGGITSVAVEVTSSNQQTGTINTSPLTFNGGDFSKTALFVPVAPGTTKVSVGTPAGYAVPASGREITFRVSPPGLVLENMTVGKDLQRQANVGLAPGVTVPMNGLMVTVQSTDPSKVLLATSPRGPSAASIQVSMPPGFIGRSSDFYVRSLAGEGAVQLTLSAEGFADSSSIVTLAPSGFVFGSFFSPDGIRTTTFASNTRLSFSPAVLDPTVGSFPTGQSIRGDSPNITVEVTSSDPSVGAVVGSPVTFHAGDAQQAFEFQPIAPGSTVLSISVPDGFSTPSPAQRQLHATVAAPKLSLYLDSQVIGKDLQARGSVSAESQPRTPVDVTVSSSDPVRVLLSTDPLSTGRSSVTVTLGQGSPQLFVQSLANRGTATVTVSAAGFTSASVNVTLAPTGFILQSQGSLTTTSLSPDTPLQIVAGFLDPSTLAFRNAQSLRGGVPSVSVEVTSSDTRVGTITTSPVVFNGGEQSKSTSFHPLASGATVIAVGIPAGFNTPSTQRQLLATVSSPGISLNSQSVGRNLQRQASLNLSAPAPRGLTVTINSGDPSRLLVSSSQRTAGSGSISLIVPTGSMSASFWVQGLDNAGSVQVIASAAGFNDGFADMPLYPSGFGFAFVYSPVNLSAGSTQFLNVSPFLLDPQSLMPVSSGADLQIRPGMGGITVDVTSSDPSVAAIIGSPLTFNGGDALKGLQVHGVSAGTASLSVSEPPGFNQPASSSQIIANVR